MRLRFFNPNDTYPYSVARPEKDEVLGPFDPNTLQGTFMEIRTGSDGEMAAYWDTDRGQWRLPVRPSTADGAWHDVRERLSEAGYSDWEVYPDDMPPCIFCGALDHWSVNCTATASPPRPEPTSALIKWARSMVIEHGHNLLPMTDEEVAYMLANDPEMRLQVAVDNAWEPERKATTTEKHYCACGWTVEKSLDAHTLWEAHVRLIHNEHPGLDCSSECAGTYALESETTT